MNFYKTSAVSKYADATKPHKFATMLHFEASHNLRIIN